MALTPDGKIVISGAFTAVDGIVHAHLARLNSDGTLDTSFDANLAPDVPVNLVAQSDGKLIIYGPFTTVAGVARPGIARLNSDGTLDDSFDPGTGPSGGGITVAGLMPNAELLVAGPFTGFDGSARDSLALLYGFDPIPQFIAPTLTNGGMRLSIRTRPGKLYHVEATDSLPPAAWRPVQALSGNGSIQTIQEAPIAGAAYFRVWTE